MTEHAWVEEFPVGITVCDAQGIILEINAKEAEDLRKEGGKALIGTNGLDCHSPAARAKMQHLLDTQSGNVYTVEKNGVKKLIFQSPWYVNGEFHGLVEFAIELPPDMPHFVRDA